VTDFNAWNQKIIDEFRTNAERWWAVRRCAILLLHSKGAKTGQERTTPMMYLAEATDSSFSRQRLRSYDPDWFRNLVAHPRASVEVGAEKFDVDAEVQSARSAIAVRDPVRALPGFRRVPGEDHARDSSRNPEPACTVSESPDPARVLVVPLILTMSTSGGGSVATWTIARSRSRTARDRRFSW